MSRNRANGTGALFGAFREDACHLATMAEILQHRGTACEIRHSGPAAIGSRHSGGSRVEAHGDILVAYSGAPFLLDEDSASVEPLDTERLAGLYKQLGVEAIKVLQGHFALSLWDRSQSRLLLARDVFGVQNLSYVMNGENIAFASEYKALLSLPGSRQLDSDAIQYFLQQGWAPAGSTFLKGIRTVPPGGVLIFQDGATTVTHFWENESRQAIPTAPIEPRRVRDTVRDAIGRHSRDVGEHYGVMLSSGVDSAMLTASLQALHPDKTIHTFTVGYGEDDPEISGARATSNCLGTVHHEIIVRPQELTALLRETIATIDNPGGYDEFPCLYALHREACKFVDVIFSGNAVDTLFAGMPYHRDLPQGDGVLFRYLCHELLHRDERMGAQEILAARFGLSFRMPYAENTMIKLALETPDHQKLDATTNKIVFRQAARLVLPEAISKRPKRIQHLQYDHVMSDWLDSQFDWIFSDHHTRECAILPATVIDKLAKRGRWTGDPQEFRSLWNAVAAATWAKIHLPANGPSAGQ